MTRHAGHPAVTAGLTTPSTKRTTPHTSGSAARGCFWGDHAGCQHAGASGAPCTAGGCANKPGCHGLPGAGLSGMGLVRTNWMTVAEWMACHLTAAYVCQADQQPV